MRVASILDDGQTFHDKRTPICAVFGRYPAQKTLYHSPSRSSTSSKFMVRCKGLMVNVEESRVTDVSKARTRPSQSPTCPKMEISGVGLYIFR